MIDLPDVAVHMIHPTLGDLPAWPLPASYNVRTYRAGDIDTWVKLHRDAEPFFEVNHAHFMESFGDHLDALPGRMFFVQSATGEDVGTVTAWWQDDWQGRGAWGQVHWVVVAPAHQRRGLAKPMTMLALRRIAQDHPRAMLGSNLQRLWALKTYLDCGFSPDPAERVQAAVVDGWRAVQQALRHPLIEEWLND